VAASRVGVTSIDIDRRRSVQLTFDDGVTCEFGLEELRRICPCATCRSLRERGEVAWPRPGQAAELWIDDAELVGAWGLSIRWSDGHATGIYSWDLLREWCGDGGQGRRYAAPSP
jgi:DUF971 family protein